MAPAPIPPSEFAVVGACHGYDWSLGQVFQHGLARRMADYLQQRRSGPGSGRWARRPESCRPTGRAVRREETRHADRAAHRPSSLDWQGVTDVEVGLHGVRGGLPYRGLAQLVVPRVTPRRLFERSDTWQTCRLTSHLDAFLSAATASPLFSKRLPGSRVDRDGNVGEEVVRGARGKAVALHTGYGRLVRGGEGFIPI